MAISIRRRELIPEGEAVVVKIMGAKQTTGQYGSQLELDLKVLMGPYAGQRFKDWSKLAVDEETGQPYIADDTKGWEVVLAAYGGNEKLAEKFKEPEELVGKVVVGQTCIRGKATKRNGLLFGSIRAYRGDEAETEAELDELPDDQDDEDDPDK